MKRVFLLSAVILVVAAVAFAEMGVKKRRPLPFEYGRVILNNYSTKEGVTPVAFNHWFHRAQFTCRLCHVDIGFAMKAGATGITAADNMRGYYCGTCHNGVMLFNGKAVFKACSKEGFGVGSTRCFRCHSVGRDVKPEYDFRKFTEKLPRGRFGNGVDWEKAELDGTIKPVDYLESVSVKRQALRVNKDFALDAKYEGMPNIIFSHEKHTAWNGCEICHPEIFNVKKGTTRYSMVDIFDGRYCGVCHGKVAFPLIDCQRCHSEPVQ